MNKQLQQKIEKIEAKKQQELEKRDKIDELIANFDNQLKILHDYKKEQQKLIQKQEELNNRVKEIIKKF